MWVIESVTALLSMCRAAGFPHVEMLRGYREAATAPAYRAFERATKQAGAPAAGTEDRPRDSG